MGDDQVFEVFRGDENMKLGWFSERYGLKEPASTIRIRKHGEGDTSFVSFINLSDIEYDIDVRQDGILQLLIHDPVNNARETVLYSLKDIQDIETENIRFSGKLLYVRETSGAQVTVYGKELYELAIGKEVTINSGEIIQSLKVMGKNYEFIISGDDTSHLHISDDNIQGLRINGKDCELTNKTPSVLDI
jgi:hypothetical protein